MTATTPASRGAAIRGPGRWLVLQALIAVLWLTAWALARIQEYAPDASLWFPPAGVTFAVGLVIGWSGLPAVLIATLAATASDMLSAGSPAWGLVLATGMSFGLAHGIAYVLGARLLLRIGSDPHSPRAAGALLTMAPASALLATLTGLAVLTVFGNVHSLEEARRIVLPFWIGDFVGVVALGPFFTIVLWRSARLLGFHPPDPLRIAAGAPTGSRTLWGLKLVACLLPLAVSAALIQSWPDQAHAASFFVFFALVPLAWIAHTEETVRTYLSAALLSTAIAGTGALLGAGQQNITYQFATIILTGSAYFGLAVPILYADNQKLRRLLTTDTLTGAATRAFFLDMSERELERARRFGNQLSLAVFDLDRFKETNDRDGHAFGDTALATAAERCRGELRAADLLGRLGGDEFALLLPMTDRDAAVTTARRVADVLRSVPVQRDGVSRTITASFGVTELAPGREPITAGLERADRALYEAKRSGRDQVVAL